jgi:transcriptional regulator with XRE-family HTH domain
VFVETPIVERKIIGVLMRAARERSHRTLKQAAQRLGVSAGRVRQYESGIREVSLPELEILALYLQVPLSYFLNPDSTADDDLPPPPQPERIKTLRIIIGERLKSARIAAGKSREDCASLLLIKSSAISRYERGLAGIPITELDRLATFLGVNLFYFVLAQHDVQVDVLDLEKLARMPKEVRMFALNAENLPYLRMAQKFRDLPHDKLKELGEILVIVK